MRPIYINNKNAKGMVLFLGIEFAYMCATLLFRPAEEAFPDIQMEAKDISVNGQKYTDMPVVALQERKNVHELPLNLKYVDRHGEGYENFYDIKFSLEITSEAGVIKNEAGLVSLELDMAEYTFSNIAVDHIYRDITVHKGILAENGEDDCRKSGNIKGNMVSKEAEQLFIKLSSLPGLGRVKQEVQDMINLVKMHRIRQERGMDVVPQSLHMVFYGNPGTGKTTVARLLAEIYKEIGVLSKGQLVEVDRSDMVSRYIGGTAIKVREAVDRAQGGILFIDEAYALTDYQGENDFGPEAVSTLLKQMEDHREDLIVIVAGYTEKMKVFLDSNPGLRSRFNRFLHFEDYSSRELTEIFECMCRENGYTVGTKCLNHVKAYFEKETGKKNFANGRTVRNLFEGAIVSQANRLAAYSFISDEELVRLRKRDVKNAERRSS